MKKTSFILIHPSNKVFGKRDNLYTNESLAPSLGLAMIAAYCREKEFTPKIIDLRLPHWSVDAALHTIKQQHPLFVGITAFTNEIVQAAKLAEIIKEQYPDLPIVVGGPHASIIPESTLNEFKGFDIAVIGEGEDTTLEIAKILGSEGESGLMHVPGIALRMNNGDIKLTSPRPIIDDINELPFPGWDLFELSFYNHLFVVSTSRGCPFSCYFCSLGYLGRRVRVKNSLKVVDEIEYLVNNFQVEKIQFSDATLSLIGEQTFIMCDEIIKRGLHSKIQWDCETRADSINQKLLKKMKEAGCRWVALGVETGNEKILREIVKKGETKEQIKKTVSLIKQVGIKVRCFFILGHYTETRETIKETIRFALQLNPDALSFGLMVPNPGSEIRRIAEKNDSGLRILNNRWQNYNQFDYDCFESIDIPLKELKKWRSNAYFSFYLHHPIKALCLFLDSSGYNYNLTGLSKIPFMLLKQRFK